MNIYKSNNLTIYYEDDDIYIKDIINYINSKVYDIFSFFNVCNRDIVIKFYYNDSEYENIVKNKFSSYYDWIIGLSYNDTIYMRSYELTVNNLYHKNMSLEEYERTVIHEIVHIVYFSIMDKGNIKYKWFSEGLATNLSGQNIKVTPISCTLKELNNNFNNIKDSYSISYTLVKYLINNYSREFILSLCTDSVKLQEFSKELDSKAHTTNFTKTLL